MLILILGFFHSLRIQLSNPSWTRDPTMKVVSIRETDGTKGERRVTPRRHDETLLLATRSDAIELLYVRVI